VYSHGIDCQNLKRAFGIGGVYEVCLERAGTAVKHIFFPLRPSREATQSRMQTCHKQQTPRVESRENVTRQNLAWCIHHALHNCRCPAVILKKVPTTRHLNKPYHPHCFVTWSAVFTLPFNRVCNFSHYVQLIKDGFAQRPPLPSPTAVKSRRPL
jgi:hypothetical protein